MSLKYIVIALNSLSLLYSYLLQWTVSFSFHIMVIKYNISVYHMCRLKFADLWHNCRQTYLLTIQTSCIFFALLAKKACRSWDWICVLYYSNVVNWIYMGHLCSWYCDVDIALYSVGLVLIKMVLEFAAFLHFSCIAIRGPIITF